MMRVIGGIYRHRQLKYLSDDLTRPTSDRIREAVFSALGNQVNNKTVLDLFAGSGAMGIEALSRGAEKATFVDIRKEAINIISENLKSLGITAEVIKSNYQAFLNKENLDQYDLIFLDPPYAFQQLSSLLETLCAKVNKDAIFVIEVNHQHDFSSFNFKKVREYKYSDKFIYIIGR